MTSKHKGGLIFFNKDSSCCSLKIILDIYYSFYYKYLYYSNRYVM